MKLNIDGAAKGTPGEASSAGVFRNALSQWIRGFAFHVGIDFALTTELKAILTGLQIAWECGFKHLILKCDSLTAISMIRNPNTSYPMFGRILKCISHWLYQSWQVTIQHSYREGNQVADKVANWALQRQDHDLHTLLPPLPEFSISLMYDLTGASIPKSVPSCI